MDLPEVRGLGRGATPLKQRERNERLILSTVQRHGHLSGRDIARLSGLTPQAVSVILRGLEADGLLERGEPERGRVGAPRLPVRLAPDGVLSVGLKLGRRSADLLLADFAGRVRGQVQATYRWPEPEGLFGFLRDGLAALTRGLDDGARARIAGIGIAKPTRIWDWHDAIGAPAGALDAWREVDFAARVAAFTDLPVLLDNDATAACRAEHLYGRGREFRDYATLFVGSFVGGGVVVNHSVFDGVFGNAGAFGSLPARGPDGREAQLIDAASLYLLEGRLRAEGLDARRMWAQPQDWSGFGPALDDWIAAAGREIARAAVTVCAVIDFEAVLVDGAFPADVRARLVVVARAALAGLDRRGLTEVRIEEGSIGGNARALGAATAPILARYLLDTHAGG